MAKNNIPSKSKFKLRKNLSHNRKIIVLLSFLFFFILLVAVLLIYFVSQNKTPIVKSNPSSSSIKAERLKLIDSTNQEVADLENSGVKTSEVAAVYDRAVDETSDTIAKSILLLEQSILYFNNGEYDNALKSAFASEAIDKNENIEQFIAQIYENKSDTANAIKYYQSAIKLVDETSPLSDSNINDYNNRINVLSGVID